MTKEKEKELFNNTVNNIKKLDYKTLLIFNASLKMLVACHEEKKTPDSESRA